MAQRLWPRISLTEWELGPRGNATPRRAPVPAARFGPVYKHTTTLLQLSLNTVFALQVKGERSKFRVKSWVDFWRCVLPTKPFPQHWDWLVEIYNWLIFVNFFYVTVHCSSAYLLEENRSCFFNNRSLTLKISLNRFYIGLHVCFCHRFFILKWSRVVMNLQKFCISFCRLKW